MVDSSSKSQEPDALHILSELNLYQSGELTQIMAAKASQGELLTPEVIAREAQGLVDRDCLGEEVDKEIYDYENASACMRRNSDFKERTVIAELEAEIGAMRKDLETNRPSLEDALKDLDTPNMSYLRYSRGHL